MKKIDITVFFQNEKSQDCGPVCTQMVLHYFGRERKLEEIKKGMTYIPNEGTYLYEQGLIFLKEGFKTELITANPLLFKQNDKLKLKDTYDILKHLTDIKRKNQSKKKAITLFRNFIKKGGKVKIEIPLLDHIIKALDTGRLVIALIYGGALGENEGGFHFVVVTGYKKGFVHINNPSKKSRQGWFPEQDFLYALYSSTCVDIDNGSFLIIGE